MGEMPMMFPVEPGVFWQQMKQVMAEVVSEYMNRQPAVKHTEAATGQPLLKINELCTIFRVSKPTLYKWIDDGRLRSFKVRNRRYFVREDVEALMQGKPFSPNPFFLSETLLNKR